MMFFFKTQEQVLICPARIERQIGNLLLTKHFTLYVEVYMAGFQDI